MFFSDINFGALTLNNVLYILIAGIVYTNICYLIYFISIKKIPAHETAILTYTTPAAVVFISYFVLLWLYVLCPQAKLILLTKLGKLHLK